MKYHCPIDIFMRPSKQYDMLFMDVYKYIHTNCLMDSGCPSVERERNKTQGKKVLQPII